MLDTSAARLPSLVRPRRSWVPFTAASETTTQEFLHRKFRMDQPNPNATNGDPLAELSAYVAEHRETLPMPKVQPPRLQAAESFAEHQEQKTAERAELRRKAELLERFAMLVQSAGLRYKDCTLENFQCICPEQSSVVRKVQEYIKQDTSSNLLLIGYVGTGKDHLAFSVCREAIRAGKTVRWIYGQEWFGMIRDAMDSNKKEAELIAEVARPGVLCLSDPLPPQGNLTQHQATMLYRLVHARYIQGRPTLCTANVNDDAEANERFTDATWDRLCHGAWKLRCAWDSYRKPRMEA